MAAPQIKFPLQIFSLENNYLKFPAKKYKCIPLTPARPPATQSGTPSLFKSPWHVIAKTSCGAHCVHNLLPNQKCKQTDATVL